MTVLVVELRRVLSRRLVWALVGVFLLGTAVAGVLVFANSHDASPDRRARIESLRRAQVEECKRSLQGPDDKEIARRCEEFTFGNDGDNRFRLTDLWPKGGRDPVIGVAAMFLAIGALVTGGSLTGAEWRANTVATMLTWEPRRARVAVAKVLAATVLAFAFGIVLLVLFAAAFLPAAYVRGITTGADRTWLRGLAGGVLRGGLLIAMAAAVGASVAMIGRNTAAAVGAAFAYLIAGEFIVRAWKPWTARLLMSGNVGAFFSGHDSHGAFTRTPGTAGLVLAFYVLTVTAVAVALFRVRDLTS